MSHSTFFFPLIVFRIILVARKCSIANFKVYFKSKYNRFCCIRAVTNCGWEGGGQCTQAKSLALPSSRKMFSLEEWVCGSFCFLRNLICPHPPLNILFCRCGPVLHQEINNFIELMSETNSILSKILEKVTRVNFF